MFEALTVQVLRISAIAVDPIALDEHPGSSLRGALFAALLRRFCMNPQATSCAACTLNPTCPVAGLVAPLRDENPRGRDVPRPFVLAAPTMTSSGVDKHALGIQPGNPLTFTLSLVGSAAQFFPYVALSMPTIEMLGLGRRLPTTGRRGRLRIERIEATDPFGDEVEPLYTRGENTMHAPTLAVTPQHIGARAAQMPADRLTIHFLTPTRLIADGHIMHTPHFHVLTLRLLERLEALASAYGEADGATLDACDASTDVAGSARRARYHRIADIARAVRLVENATRWVDVGSYSSRQRRVTPIGGFVGQATYEGDIGLLRELLAWGEVLHVGKNAVKGDGLLRVDIPAQHR